MIKKKWFVSFFCSFAVLQLQAQLQPIGQWREHTDYHAGLKVTISGTHVYTATKFGAYSVSREEGEIERLSKVSGLHDIGISSIKYNSASDKLLIAYNNSNLDVIYRNDIINIPAIMRSNISGDKTIYDITFVSDKAYLSCGLGVIVVDLTKYEISNTWLIGNNGANVKVNGFAADATRFFAATAEGLKVANQNAGNLNDYRNWTLVSGSNGLPVGEIKQVMAIGSNVIVQYNSSLYLLNGNNWQLLYNDDWSWENVNASDGSVLICEGKNSWNERRVIVLNVNGSISLSIQNNNQLTHPMQAVKSGSEIWIADYNKGLVKAEGNVFDRYAVNSPYGNLDGEMFFYNNTLFVAGGSINYAWNYKFNPTGFFTFSNNEWKDYNRSNLPWMDSVYDIITMAVDPRNNLVYAGSFGGGLIEYENSTKYKIYKQNFLNVTVGDPNSYRVGGLAFDADNNLWISNFGGANNFVVKKADGSWKSLKVPFLIIDNMVGQILIDDANQKWIQVPQGNGVYCFNHGSSIDNTGDDHWKWLQAGKGNGNLPDNAVNCMVKDKDGFIWLGTDKGIGIIQCPGEIFTSNGCESYQPIVQQDNFAGYLFQNEEVKALAVDGANRKWVGTHNGVWLISADGEKIIQRFTAENSPLLSNEIIRIAIDPKTGEVFFSTFNGICSYRSTATEASENDSKVLIFPSPVPSGYEGTIGIRGLPENAVVKITELSGRLVYQTRSLGGQAVWNGRDYRNQRVSSGVYLVFAKIETGPDKQVGKIVFIK